MPDESDGVFIAILEGVREFTLDDAPYQLPVGESIVTLAGTPHSVCGVSSFKM